MALFESDIKSVPLSSTGSTFDFTCGHCGCYTGGRVTSLYDSAGKIHIRFIICRSCTKGSVWNYPDQITPGSLPGTQLEGLPEEVNSAYAEARNCFSVNAFTACELLCRKILMHIAVDKGAKEGETFQTYLQYLETKRYITPLIKSWADLIRTHGNSSTHSLEKLDKKRAEATFNFTMQLLRIVYEMPNKASEYTLTV